MCVSVFEELSRVLEFESVWGKSFCRSLYHDTCDLGQAVLSMGVSDVPVIFSAVPTTLCGAFRFSGPTVHYPGVTFGELCRN